MVRRKSAQAEGLTPSRPEVAVHQPQSVFTGCETTADLPIGSRALPLIRNGPRYHRHHYDGSLAVLGWRLRGRLSRYYSVAMSPTSRRRVVLYSCRRAGLLKRLEVASSENSWPIASLRVDQ